MAKTTPIQKRITLFNRVFGTDDGMKVLTQLMKECHYFDTTFEAGDPYTSAFNEGQRSVVSSLIKRVSMAKRDPSFYIESSLPDQQE